MNTDPEKVMCRWRQRWEPQGGTPREPGGAWSRIPLSLRRNSQHPISGSQTLAQELTEHCHLTSTSNPGNSRPLSLASFPWSSRHRQTWNVYCWCHCSGPFGAAVMCSQLYLQGASLVTHVTPWSLWFPFHYRGRSAFCFWQEWTVKALCWNPGPKVSEKEEK